MTDPITVYSTCPPSSAHDAATYAATVAETARWSEEQGLHGMLIYTDNSLVDPWQAATVAIQNTERLVPLVAVQPVYMHPYSAAVQVASLAFLHGRRIDLNMLAGGFVGDLTARRVDHHGCRFHQTQAPCIQQMERIRGRRAVDR